MKAALLCLLVVFSVTFAIPAQPADPCYWSECYYVGIFGYNTNHCKEGYMYNERITCPEYSFWHVKQHCCPI
uniref:Chitin-binding type-2 domain-containing protein n=1 Tax=Steinernema glaseri TaxID=37863 RepID=A0A1I7Y079_9BILA